MERVDVAIVGGGPAGSAAAHAAATDGADALVLERGSPCRPRPARSGFDRCRWHPRLLGRHHGDPPRRVRRRDRPARAEPRGVPRSGRVGDAHKHRNRLLVRQVQVTPSTAPASTTGSATALKTPAPSTARACRSAASTPTPLSRPKATTPTRRRTRLRRHGRRGLRRTRRRPPAHGDEQGSRRVPPRGRGRLRPARLADGEPHRVSGVPARPRGGVRGGERRHRLLVGRDARRDRVPVDLPERRPGSVGSV